MLVSRSENGMQIDNPIVLQLLDLARHLYNEDSEQSIECGKVVEVGDNYEIIVYVRGISIAQFKDATLKNFYSKPLHLVPIKISIKKNATYDDNCYNMTVEDEKFIGRVIDFPEDFAKAKGHALSSMVERDVIPLHTALRRLNEKHYGKIRLIVGLTMLGALLLGGFLIDHFLG